MSVHNREEQLKLDIMQWQEQLSRYEVSKWEKGYEEWIDKMLAKIPEETAQTYLQRMDGWLYQMTTVIQGTQLQTNAKDRILETARVFNSDIDKVEDLQSLSIDQLSFICEQQVSKQRLVSLIQGTLAGTGKPILLGTDLVAMLATNLHAIHVIGMSYGYKMNSPFELMLSLKVFHAASLPKRWQRNGWEMLVEELRETDLPFFYEGDEQVIDKTWIEKAGLQIGKAGLILLTKRQSLQKLPLISMAIGAGVNYQFTKQVTDYAKRFYQYRFLEGKDETYSE